MNKYAQPATKALVIDYLHKLHGYDLPDAKATVEKYTDIVDVDIKCDSFANYAAETVLSADGHECDDDCKEEGDNADDDDGDWPINRPSNRNDDF